MPQQWFRKPWPAACWLPWLCGAAAFAIAARNLIGTYADLGIYLDVAREFVAGGHDLYRERHGMGPWAYPPVAALPVAALQLALGDDGARWAWCALLGLATTWIVRSLLACARETERLAWWQWLVFAVLFQRCVAQNLTHGQMSLFVAAFVAAGVADLVRGRDLRAGMWLGLATALKITPLLFLGALLPMRRLRAAAAMATAIVLAVFVAPWPIVGTVEHLRHLRDFQRTAVGIAIDDGSSSLAQAQSASIPGTLPFLLQARPVNADGDTVHLVDVGGDMLRVVQIAWSIAIGSLLLAWFAAARRHADAERLLQQCGAVLLAMSLFAPLLRVYHLAAALPAFLLFCRGPRHRGDGLWYATVIALLLSMTLRQKRLLGEHLWRAFDAGGLLHFALVGLIAWCAGAARQSRLPN